MQVNIDKEKDTTKAFVMVLSYLLIEVFPLLPPYLI